ncbi:MAG: alpha/beta fold hydrolase [Myxococcota bacterium]
MTRVYEREPGALWFVRGAQPMVFLHGFTGSPASWTRVAENLPDRQAAVALALPGHDPATPVASGWDRNIDRLAKRIAALAAAQHGSDRSATGVHLCGYSLGARAALGVAVRHPALLTRLTLIGVHPGLPDDAARHKRIASDREWSKLLRDRGITAFVAAWEDHPVFAGQKRLERAVIEGQRAVRLSHDPAALAASLEHMGLGQMPDYSAPAVDLAMRVTFIAGERDRKYCALAEDLTARRGAPGSLLRVSGCGHNPVLERPRALAALLTRGERA